MDNTAVMLAGSHPVSKYSVGRKIAKDIETRDKHRRTYRKIQKEAEARPESVRVDTSDGEVWMSPIEHSLYEAMLREGLTPIAQCLVEGYIVDFAFPDIKMAIEADGAAFHDEDRRDRDRKRDWILGRKGWTVKRYTGTTIHNKPGNCAYEIKREVEERRMRAEEEAAGNPFSRFLRNLKGDSRKRP
jgi:very-short-patch-repair endonuclease